MKEIGDKIKCSVSQSSINLLLCTKKQLAGLQECHLQVLHGDLHAGQVHVGNPGSRALRPVANREGVGERLSHHRLVAGDGGHGGPVTLVSDEAGDPGHLVVRRYPVPAGEGWGEGGPDEAKKEQTRSPQNSAHGWIQSLGDSRLV